MPLPYSFATVNHASSQLIVAMQVHQFSRFETATTLLPQGKPSKQSRAFPTHGKF
jgi:hypothetical protein